MPPPSKLLVKLLGLWERDVVGRFAPTRLVPPSWFAHGCDAAQEVEVLRLALAILFSVAGFEEKTRPGVQGMTRGEMYGPLERGDPGEANPKTVRAVQLGRLAAVL